MIKGLQKLGHPAVNMLSYIGAMGYLLSDTLYWILIAPRKKKQKIRWEETFRQMVNEGVRSIPIVFLVMIFMGITVALLSARGLMQYGAEAQMSGLVTLGIVRELGPLLTAIVMSGFVGAAFAAEIGTMKVSEEILALETSAINPVRFLVVPRMLGLIVMLVAVTHLGDVVGMLGGYIVGSSLMDIDSHLYWSGAFEFLKLGDVVIGFLKSAAFAIIIATVGCHEGLRTTGGAEGVGRATTSSVVVSIVLIIAVNCIFSAGFFIFKQ